MLSYGSFHDSCLVIQWKINQKQTCKPRSYASSKIRPSYFTQSLTGVKCRATNAAKITLFHICQVFTRKTFFCFWPPLQKIYSLHHVALLLCTNSHGGYWESSVYKRPLELITHCREGLQQPTAKKTFSTTATHCKDGLSYSLGKSSHSMHTASAMIWAQQGKACTAYLHNSPVAFLQHISCTGARFQFRVAVPHLSSAHITFNMGATCRKIIFFMICFISIKSYFMILNTKHLKI